MEDDRSKRNVKLAFSCNDNTSHKAWIEDIKAATGADVVPVVPDRAAATELGILDFRSTRDAKGMPFSNPTRRLLS
jgi:alkyl hydroperoxide reductase subunit AhpC